MTRAGAAAASPLTRQQITTLPFVSAALGAAMGGFFWPLLGRGALLALAAMLAVSLGALGAWIAWRSDFATRHGLVGALYLLLLLVPLTAGTAVMTVSLAGAPQLAGWAAGSVALAMLACSAWAWQRQSRRLEAEGADGPWARTNVDPTAGRMRADALRRTPGDPSPWTPPLVAALAANAALVWRGWGFADHQAMPVVLALLMFGSLWVCAAAVGPMLGKARFLRRLERGAGRAFVHEGWDDLQAQRRSVALARRFMA